MRQVIAVALSAFCLSALPGAVGTAAAADLSYAPYRMVGYVPACPPKEQVVLYDERGRPTVPARTPYHYCVTGRMLLPGDIPPPPEYCCH